MPPQTSSKNFAKTDLLYWYGTERLMCKTDWDDMVALEEYDFEKNGFTLNEIINESKDIAWKQGAT